MSFYNASFDIRPDDLVSYNVLPAAAFGALLLVMLCGCAERNRVPLRLGGEELPGIVGLDSCDDFGTEPLQLEPDAPVTVLVHGCKASSGRYRYLAKIFEEQGHQTVCFTYDYRDTIEGTSGQLLTALNELRRRIDQQQVTVVGHSQGGLVSRRALIQDREDGLSLDAGSPVRLATVSAPFNGIRSSETCGKIGVHIVSLGITAAVCQGIAGSNWREIHPRSELVNEPGELSEMVSEHLQIVTDERGSCRRRDEEGECLEDDFVFAVEEQRQELVERDERVVPDQIREGHALVIGMDNAPPLSSRGVSPAARVYESDESGQRSCFSADARSPLLMHLLDIV